jgi:hypothetical protein
MRCTTARCRLRAFAAVGRAVLLTVFLFVCVGHLRRATGQCPWDYGGARWAVSGLIRLDYLPCWAAACWMFERLFVALHSRLG